VTKKRNPTAAAGVLAAAFLLAACATSAPPAQQVETYLRARASSNVNQMVSLSCGAWEAQARIEASSFKALNARVDGLTCQASGSDGAVTFVGCAGKIITSYNGESREVSLADKQFKTVNEGGEWRVCGYR
jgi:ABC-type phosphate transport system substrate-binding protein